jgi:hypothetical protein
VQGFAVLCVTTPPSGLVAEVALCDHGRLLSSLGGLHLSE